MKHKSLIPALLLVLVLLCSCSSQQEYAPIAATTLPVFEFTSRLCADTDLTVTRLVTESVSCLHDYSLNVRQVRAAEAAELIVINGAHLEEFMEDLLEGKNCIDSSVGIEILASEAGHSHEEEDVHHPQDGHNHELDNHIWLSPKNAMIMAQNICSGLCTRYPQYEEIFTDNLEDLLADLQDLHAYGEAQLSQLSCRELITFHDGFSYFAESFDLHIVRAVEEESGAEASAAELIELIEEVRRHDLPAIFIETNGSDSAASVISRETGAAVHILDMAMSGDSYFDAMYHNINTLKEALG